MSKPGPVETLLRVDEGARLDLEAKYYDFASEAVVEDIDEHRWRAPNGGIWRSRRISLRANPDGAGRSASYEVDVHHDGPTPEIGSHGDLVEARPAEEAPADYTDAVDRIQWLGHPPSEILDRAWLSRDLAGVLDAVDQSETCLGLANRLGVPFLEAKRIAFKLGLRDPDMCAFRDDVDQRLNRLREVCLDE